jgi:hypothetical protein
MTGLFLVRLWPHQLSLLQPAHELGDHGSIIPPVRSLSILQWWAMSSSSDELRHPPVMSSPSATDEPRHDSVISLFMFQWWARRHSVMSLSSSGDEPRHLPVICLVILSDESRHPPLTNSPSSKCESLRLLPRWARYTPVMNVIVLRYWARHSLK